MRKLWILGFIFILNIAIVATLFARRENSVRTNLFGYKREDQLEPTRLKFVQEYYVLDNVAAKLVELGKLGEYQNALAEEFRIAEDGRSIHIKLRKAVFSDGTAITATDVASSIKRATILGTPHSNLKGLWVGSDKLTKISDEIEGVKVLSENELELKLTRASKELLYFFTMTDLSILHKSQYEKNVLKASDWMGVTSGPYHIEYTKLGHMSLVANKTAFNYSESMPQLVTFESYKGDDVIERLKNKSLEFGTITLVDYLNHAETVEKTEGLEIFGNKTDGIVNLVLNLKSKQFSKLSTRQWVQKRILEGYQIDDKYQKGITKAHQFFLPKAKGYIPDAKVIDLLSHIKTDVVPEELKSGINIQAIGGMKDYMPTDIAQSLSRVLGVPVKIDLTTPSREYFNFLGKREFDATIIGISMVYKVLGETLNLQYFSPNPTFLDPSGNIHRLMESYQNKEDIKEELSVIGKILEQMVVDSECVPVFYFSMPFFANTERVDVSNLNLDESIQFWKVKMK